MFSNILRFLRKTGKILKKILVTSFISIPAWIVSAGPAARYSLLLCKGNYEESELFYNTETQQLITIRARGLGLSSGGLENRAGGDCYLNIQRFSSLLIWITFAIVGIMGFVGLGTGDSFESSFLTKTPVIMSMSIFSIKIALDLINVLLNDDYYQCMYDQIRCRFRYYILRDYNVQNNLGDTELHKAIYLEDIVSVHSLLERGHREKLNLDIRNKEGLTAFDLINVLQNRELQSDISFCLTNMDYYFSQTKEHLLKTAAFPEPLRNLIVDYIKPLTFSSYARHRMHGLPSEIITNPDLVSNPDLTLEIKEPEEVENTYGYYRLLA